MGRQINRVAMVALATACLIAPLNPSHSAGDKVLAGIDRAELLIEELGDDGEKCGLREEAIEATVVLYLSNNTGLRIVEDADPTVYVNVLTSYREDDQLCVGFVNVSIEELVSLRDVGSSMVTSYSKGVIVGADRKD